MLAPAVFIVLSVQVLKPVIQLSSQSHRSAATNLALMVLTAAALWLTARFVDKREFADFGLRLEPRPLLIGSAIGFALVAAIVAIEAALGWVRVTVLWYSQFPAESFAWLFLVQVGRSYFGSVFEEAFSRGVLLKNSAEGLAFTHWSASRRIWVAYGLSAVLFGLQHAGNTGVTPLALANLAGLGVLFGAARVWTGSLSFGIGMHATWNIGAANVFGLLDAGGVRDVSILLLDTAAHFPWTGGGYGIEGDAIATVVIALAAVGLVGVPSIRGRQAHLPLADSRSRSSDCGGGAGDVEGS
jgi:hypothetical protein